MSKLKSTIKPVITHEDKRTAAENRKLDGFFKYKQRLEDERIFRERMRKRYEEIHGE